MKGERPALPTCNNRDAKLQRSTERSDALFYAASKDNKTADDI